MPEGKLFKEKRVAPRIKVDIQVQYHRVEDKSEIESVKRYQKESKGGRAMDVSLSGLHIESAQPLHSGDVLNLEITLPNLPVSLPAFAEVVWADATQGGLHFLKMSDEDVQVLKAFLNKAMKTRDKT